jgi:uracil-DNA glycosylase
MLTKRIIPCLDVNDGRVVKGINFVQLRDAGDPVEVGKAYSNAGADELVFLDITATSDARNTVVDLVRKVAEQIFIPFTVGGGIRTVEDMRAVLREGADKVAINSAAINRPELISESADKFGTIMPMISNDWLPALKEEFGKDYYKKLYKFVLDEYHSRVVYPPADDIFNALHLTPLQDVKVLILGQDPYHEPGQAHGLSFSVLPGQDAPPSLVNIYAELKDDLGCYVPNNGYLKKWADQGVLLLNTVLTVRAHAANSHKGRGWENFTDAIIKALNEQDRPIVYMLWGKPAQTKMSMLNNPKQLILTAPHPSPLSAYRGFFGCKHFSKCNEFLIANGLEPIDWQIENI